MQVVKYNKNDTLIIKIPMFYSKERRQHIRDSIQIVFENKINLFFIVDDVIETCEFILMKEDW